MSKDLKEATEQLLGKEFIQKGSKFRNLVTAVTINNLKDDEIIITYRTLNNDSGRTPVMEYKQFLGSHFI